MSGCDTVSAERRSPAAAAGREALRSVRSKVSFSPPIASSSARLGSLSIRSSPPRRRREKERARSWAARGERRDATKTLVSRV